MTAEKIKLIPLVLIGILGCFRLASQCTPPGLVIDNLPAAVCEDASPVPLVGYPSGGFFLINGNAVNFFDPAVVGVGNHAVTYFLVYNPACPAVNLTQLVSVKPVLHIQPVLDTITCLNPLANLGLTASGQVTNYQWFGPNGFFSDEPSPSAGVPGDYFVIADNGACSASASLQISENLAPTSNPVALGGTIECVSNSLQLAASCDVTDAQYSWLGPGGFTSDQQAPVVTEAGQYLVNIQDPDNGCITSLSVDVMAPPLPDLSASVSGIITCKDPEASLSMVSNTPNVSFSWLFPDNSSVSGAQVNVNAPGQYLAIVEDAMGCKKIMDVEVEEDKTTPSVTPDVSGNILNCIIQTIELGVVTDLPPGLASFIWLGPQQNQISNTELAQATEPGIYSVVVTNLGNGCTASEVQNINLDNTAPVAIADIDHPICLNAQGVLQGGGSLISGPATYHWESVEGNWIETPSSIETGIEFSGTYVLLVTDLSNGCTDTDSIFVAAPDNFPDGLTVEVKNPGCIGNNGTIIMKNTMNLPLAYNFQNAGASSISTYEDLVSGEYTIVIAEVGACVYDTIIQLLPPPEFKVDLYTTTPEINQGEQVEIQTNFTTQIDEVKKISWEKARNTICEGCFVVTDNPIVSTTYRVYAETIDGCHGESILEVLVKKNLDFYTGNIFSPNLDGLNDMLIPQFGPSIQKAVNFRVFDRWGSLVYELNDTNLVGTHSGWDGTYNGYDVEPGVYVYSIEIEYIDGRKVIVTGDVTVLR